MLRDRFLSTAAYLLAPEGAGAAGAAGSGAGGDAGGGGGDGGGSAAAGGAAAGAGAGAGADAGGSNSGSAGADAGAAADWRAGLEGEHLEFAKRLESPKDAVKVALDFRKQNSAMIRVPGEKATPEDLSKFRKAIGVPDKPEDYEFDLGREPTDQDKAVQSAIAKVALENGVPKPALKAMTKAVADLAQAQLTEADRVAVKARETSEATLKKEWGADYEANVTLAQRALKTFGKDQATLDFLNTTVNGQKIGDHPVVVKMFGNIGRRMGEGEFIGAVGAGERQSLNERINKIMRDNPPGTEKYKAPEVQRELATLTEQLAGSGPAERLG